MARIKYSALVENIRGSIGGTTFQRNAYGYTVKSKPAIVNPQTPRQRERKSAMQAAQSRWQNIGDGNRATWDTYATNYPVPSRLNPDAYLGGQQLFIRHFMLGSMIPVVAETTDGGPLTITNPTFRVVRNGLDLYVEGDADAQTEAMYVLAFLAPRLSVTQNIVKSKLRYCGNGTSSTSAYEIDIAANYLAIFGTLPVVGDFVGLQIVFFGDDNATVIRTQPIYYEVEAP